MGNGSVGSSDGRDVESEIEIHVVYMGVDWVLLNS